MSFRNHLRALVIRSASLAHVDQLALYLKKHSSFVIVAMHETPASLESRFRAQLEWVSRYFEISDLPSLAAFWQNPRPSGKVKPSILFTFDDGRESNYHIAAPLLESFGARGLFFVVPAFAECSPEDALNFYRCRINPDSRPGDETWEDWKPMNPAQIASLAARGHAIGNHTLTHARLVGLSTQDLEREIGESARKLAAWTNRPIEAFAWTFGWDAIDANALQVIQRYHRFCFTPCAGSVDPNLDSPALLWRREVEVKYSPAECRFCYSGLVDAWWRARRQRLRRMSDHKAHSPGQLNE
jgi:peptidoglycan/xylan/chitin deacetylase (PgdA/CDA1 family)